MTRAVWWKSYFLDAPAQFKRAPYLRPAPIVPFATTQRAELIGATPEGNAIVNWGGHAMMLHLTSVDDDITALIKTWANGGQFDELYRQLTKADRSSGNAASGGETDRSGRRDNHQRKPANVQPRRSADDHPSTHSASDCAVNSVCSSDGPSAPARRKRLHCTVYQNGQLTKTLPVSEYAKYRCAAGETKKMEVV